MTSCPPPMAWPPISTLSAHSFSLFLSIGYERLSLSIENRNMLCRTYYNSRGVPQTVPPRWDTFFGLADHGRILRWDTLVVSEVVTRRWRDTSFGQADVSRGGTSQVVGGTVCGTPLYIFRFLAIQKIIFFFTEQTSKPKPNHPIDLLLVTTHSTHSNFTETHNQRSYSILWFIARHSFLILWFWMDDCGHFC